MLFASVMEHLDTIVFNFKTHQRQALQDTSSSALIDDPSLINGCAQLQGMLWDLVPTTSGPSTLIMASW